jgi:hypothetical protein
MKFVTVATKSDGYFPIYLQSCHRHNIEPVILGWGKKWQGFSWRLELIINYLKTLPADELVVFTDAYDVLILKSPTEIERRYLKLAPNKDKLVVSYEQPPQLGSISNLFYGFCNGMRINAGTYMGPAALLLNTFRKLYTVGTATATTDDQVLMTKDCNENRETYLIDDQSHIFHVCIRHKQSPTCIAHSCILHGPLNRDLLMFAKQLGYDTSDVVIRKSYRIQQFASIFRHFITDYPTVVTVYVIAVVLIIIAALYRSFFV